VHFFADSFRLGLNIERHKRNEPKYLL